MRTLDPDWIRVGIQPKMPDPDPYQMNTDPNHMTILYVSHLVHCQGLQEAPGDAMLVRMSNPRYAYRRLLQGWGGLAIAAQRDGVGSHPGSVPVRAFAEKRHLSQTVLWICYIFWSDTDPKGAKNLRIRIHHTDCKQCFGYGYDSRIWPARWGGHASRLRSRRSLRKKAFILWIRDIFLYASGSERG